MQNKFCQREIELLAPARDASVAIDAINCGADAVYMGAHRFGARSLAGNSVDDLARVADYAHQFNAKLYATVNTIIYDNELKEVEHLIRELYNVGVDALIVQDMSILRMDIPPIALHSSTQCDLRTPEKARFLSEVGFSQLVMARELSLPEINAIHLATDAKLEAFVYGALCVSYSGRCQISEALMNRSANRGECAQICRLKYDLVDQDGNVILDNKHFLSLKDLNQNDRMLEMIQAGVSSFKIEGRLKDSNYVKNSVSYFRKKLDGIIAAYPQLYKKSSTGASTIGFEPVLEKCFNRSFTHYFLENRFPQNGETMASMLTPKSQGEYIGTLKYKNKKYLAIDSEVTLCNGDGLSFYDGTEFTGFRVNRVENDKVFFLSDLHIPENAKLYRTYNKQHDDEINNSLCERKIAVDFVLRRTGNTLVIDASDERGNCVTATVDVELLEKSKTDQRLRQTEVMAKLGNTIYKLNKCEILTDAFIPMSILSDLRRKVVNLLNDAQQINYRSEKRKPENFSYKYCDDKLVSSDNVSNTLSRMFYESHGVKAIENAFEIDKSHKHQLPLMHTRYCIRRELGACKKTRDANKLPEKLFLKTGKTTLRVECDCQKCEMKIYLSK